MDWDEERRAILHVDRIGDMEPGEACYAEQVLLACQEAIQTPFYAMDRLEQIDWYDGDFLDSIGIAIMETSILEQTRRETLYGALKMAQAYIWQHTPVNDD